MHIDANRVALSIPETAAALSVSRRQVYKLMDSGELPTFRIGTRRLIHVDDLRAFAERCRVASAA